RLTRAVALTELAELLAVEHVHQLRVDVATAVVAAVEDQRVATRTDGREVAVELVEVAAVHARQVQVADATARAAIDHRDPTALPRLILERIDRAAVGRLDLHFAHRTQVGTRRHVQRDLLLTREERVEADADAKLAT